MRLNSYISRAYVVTVKFTATTYAGPADIGVKLAMKQNIIKESKQTYNKNTKYTNTQP